MWKRLIYHPEVNYALRQTLVLGLPVAIGWLMGDLQKGLLLAFVPACCNVAGLDTLHRRFFKRLIIGGSLFALSSFLIQWLSHLELPLPLILLFMALIIGVAGEISPLHARLLPASLIAATFTLSLIDRMPLWGPPLLYLVGTLWYGLFNGFWFWLCKAQPLRETLSLLFRQMAIYCEEKYDLRSQNDPEKVLPSLFAKQQKIMDLITTCYQQFHMLTATHRHNRYLAQLFQVALDIQEHISVSFYHPKEVQELLDFHYAEPIIRWNITIINTQLRQLSKDILYHKVPENISMKKPLRALKKITIYHPNNRAGIFYYYNFSRISRLLQDLRPLYQRDLMTGQKRHLPFLSALRSYLSLKSTALRTAARFAVMLAVGSTIALFFNIPKSYWILMTTLLVSQNSYSSTRVRIQHRALGTVAGLIIASITLHFSIRDSIILVFMLAITLISYLLIRNHYGLAIIGSTITAVYSLQLLSLNGTEFLLPRLLDTLIGCCIAFCGMAWLWPQWQSGLLRKNARDILNADLKALQMILSDVGFNEKLAYQRIQVNQAQNALFNSLNQAMQEPAFNADYLSDMKLWVTHSQFIVEHINAMTILAREHSSLTCEIAQKYLALCEKALYICEQRLDDESSKVEKIILDTSVLPNEGFITVLEHHIKRILGHLNVMNTISFLAWKTSSNRGNKLREKI